MKKSSPAINELLSDEFIAVCVCASAASFWFLLGISLQPRPVRTDSNLINYPMNKTTRTKKKCTCIFFFFSRPGEAAQRLRCIFFSRLLNQWKFFKKKKKSNFGPVLAELTPPPALWLQEGHSFSFVRLLLRCWTLKFPLAARGLFIRFGRQLFDKVRKSNWTCGRNAGNVRNAQLGDLQSRLAPPTPQSLPLPATPPPPFFFLSFFLVISSPPLAGLLSLSPPGPPSAAARR